MRCQTEIVTRPSSSFLYFLKTLLNDWTWNGFLWQGCTLSAFFFMCSVSKRVTRAAPGYYREKPAKKKKIHMTYVNSADPFYSSVLSVCGWRASPPGKKANQSAVSVSSLWTKTTVAKEANGRGAFRCCRKRVKLLGFENLRTPTLPLPEWINKYTEYKKYFCSSKWLKTQLWHTSMFCFFVKITKIVRPM